MSAISPNLRCSQEEVIRFLFTVEISLPALPVKEMHLRWWRVIRLSRCWKKAPIFFCSSSDGIAISWLSKSFLLRLPIAPFPPATNNSINRLYQDDPIEAFTKCGSFVVPRSINPPWTADSSGIPLIIVCFPTSLDDPFAAVMRMSFALAQSILTASRTTKTSSSLNAKLSSAIFDERRTRTPFFRISEGLYVSPRRVATTSENLRCSQENVEVVNIIEIRAWKELNNNAHLRWWRVIRWSRQVSSSPIFLCSSISGIGIGIWKNTLSLIENLSDLAPESPLKFIKECQ